MGPFKGREYEDLNVYDLGENARWAQLRLNTITGNGLCGWAKYAGRNLTWNQVREIDSNYYDWARDELVWMVANSRDELGRQEQKAKAAPPPPRPAPAMIEPPPLYNESEQKEIAAGNFVADWREWAHKGWRSSALNFHPDTGGSHEAMVRHKRAKELFDRLLEDFEKELRSN